MQILDDNPEIAYIERTGYPSWTQEEESRPFEDEEEKY